MSEPHGDLFERAASDRGTEAAVVPLAERMRPRSLLEVIGQDHVLGEGRLLHGVVERRRLPSLLLWGAPGTGKTTLARILAGSVSARFEVLSATSAGVKDVREVIERARKRGGTATVLFVDEIHRFNRGQQDALLPHVEDGTVTLIGATTENPSFEVNAALLSRMRVVRLRPLAMDALVEILRRALADPDRGLGGLDLEIEDRFLRGIALAAEGDARKALGTLEIAVDLLGPGERILDERVIAQALVGRPLRHDRAGDAHYDVTSALIKCMRASDPDAAVYWMTRMLEAGEDPMFVARRLLIFASEDVGNADPQAIVVAAAAASAVHVVGMPEAGLILSQACLYLALADKSNAATRALGAARKDVVGYGALEVPLVLRNAVTALMKQEGHGAGRQDPHAQTEGVVPGRATGLPEGLAERRYFEPGPRGWEAAAFARLLARLEPRR